MSTQVLKPASTKYAADHYDEFVNKRPTPSIVPPVWARGPAYRDVVEDFERSENKHERAIRDSLDERGERLPERRPARKEEA